MKVFLSWSGRTSHKVAIAFKDWLPQVIQSLVPYVSSEDIDKGTRWSTDIAKELEESDFGIILVTNENMAAPWVNFEAGALSKIIDKANVSPFLFNVKRSEINGPLLQFQSTIFEKDDICKLLKSINRRMNDSEKLEEQKLERSFGVWWDELEGELNKIQREVGEQQQLPQQQKNQNAVQKSEILEELLHLVRDQHKIMSNPDRILPPEYLSYLLDRVDRPSKRNISEKSYAMLHRDLSRMQEFVQHMDCSSEEREKLQIHFDRLHARFHDVFDIPRRRIQRAFLSDEDLS